MTSSDINAKMAKCIPVLGSKYAQYPMKREVWPSPDGKAPDGEPLFISSAKNDGVKEHYVYYSRRTLKWGPGYYHILTKASYTILWEKFYTSVGTGSGCCGGGMNQQAKDWHDVMMIVKGRAHSPRPHDDVARKSSDAFD